MMKDCYIPDFDFQQLWFLYISTILDKWLGLPPAPPKRKNTLSFCNPEVVIISSEHSATLICLIALRLEVGYKWGILQHNN